MKRAVIYFGFRDPRGHKRGVENVIVVQARALPGCRKYYIFFDAHSSVRRWEDAIAIGLTFNVMRFIALNRLVMRLKERLEKRGYTVIIHSHNYLMSLLSWVETDAFTVHDGLWYQKKTIGSKCSWIYYLLERIVYKRTGRVHCNSRFTYQKSLLLASRKGASIIYCSTPLERIACERVVGPASSTQCDTSLVLSVRSMERRARIDLVLDTAERAQKENHPLRFIVAGKGPLLESYRREIVSRNLVNIKLLGYVSDSALARLYSSCDVVLMTCEDGEGFGLPIIEGYLFGKPVIASNRCAVPEVLLSPDYLVDNNCGQIIERLVKQSKVEVAPELFRDYYCKRFSNRVIEARFARFYDAVFEGRSIGRPT